VGVQGSSVPTKASLCMSCTRHSWTTSSPHTRQQLQIQTNSTYIKARTIRCKAVRIAELAFGQQMNTKRRSFRVLGPFAKLQKRGYQLRHAGLSVRMELGMKFDIFIYFFRICPGKSGFIKIWQGQRIGYTKIQVHSWYLAQFFLRWEMFQTRVVQKFRTRVLRSKTSPPPNSCRL